MGGKEKSSRIIWLWKPLPSFLTSIKSPYLGLPWTPNLFFLSFLPFSSHLVKIGIYFPSSHLLIILEILAVLRVSTVTARQNLQVPLSGSSPSSGFITCFLLGSSADGLLDALYLQNQVKLWFYPKIYCLTCPSLLLLLKSHNLPVQRCLISRSLFFIQPASDTHWFYLGNVLLFHPHSLHMIIIIEEIL